MGTWRKISSSRFIVSLISFLFVHAGKREIKLQSIGQKKCSGNCSTHVPSLLSPCQAVIMVIESMHEKTEEAMCKLLQSLFRSFVITIDQMRNGFERVYDAMPEIAIDVPAAYRLVNGLIQCLCVC